MPQHTKPSKKQPGFRAAIYRMSKKHGVRAAGTILVAKARGSRAQKG